MRRRIEITAVETERVLVLPALTYCPVCRLRTQLLTPAQAAAFAQVAAPEVERWQDEGKSHGAHSAGSLESFPVGVGQNAPSTPAATGPLAGTSTEPKE